MRSGPTGARQCAPPGALDVPAAPPTGDADGAVVVGATVVAGATSGVAAGAGVVSGCAGAAATAGAGATAAMGLPSIGLPSTG